MTTSTSTSTSEQVTSRDGTRIGYLRQGNGPGLVLVQGAMGTAAHYSELATALSDTFTVYSVDRRGRGLSPKRYDRSHDIARDVEDIDAVLTATESHAVFGLSSGAIITLQAAEALPCITAAIVYEPPFYPDGISHSGIERLNLEIERGRLGSALVTALLTSQTGPAALRYLPRPLAQLLGHLILRVERRVNSGTDSLQELVPGIRYDFRDVGGMDGRITTFHTLEKAILLINGTRSPEFLRSTIHDLAVLLPDAQRVELDGLSHSGPWNKARGGQPQRVADAIQSFLTRSNRSDAPANAAPCTAPPA